RPPAAWMWGAAPADHRPAQPRGLARCRGPAGLPRAVGGGTVPGRGQDAPERPRGPGAEQAACGGGPGGLRVSAGALRHSAGHARCGGDRLSGPGSVVVQRRAADPTLPPARVPPAVAPAVVRPSPARGAPAAVTAQAGEVVSARHQAQDVELEEKTTTTPSPTAADQTLS